MTSVGPAIRVEVVASLVFFGDVGTFGEVQSGAGEHLYNGSVDVPTDPVGENGDF